MTALDEAIWKLRHAVENNDGFSVMVKPDEAKALLDAVNERQPAKVTVHIGGKAIAVSPPPIDLSDVSMCSIGDSALNVRPYHAGYPEHAA